jgi:hypothetical protein
VLNVLHSHQVTPAADAETVSNGDPDDDDDEEGGLEVACERYELNLIVIALV